MAYTKESISRTQRAYQMAYRLMRKRNRLGTELNCLWEDGYGKRSAAYMAVESALDEVIERLDWLEKVSGCSEAVAAAETSLEAANSFALPPDDMNDIPF